MVWTLRPKKYKLAEFLRTRVIAAQDVTPVLAKVEPSNPFYLRARVALEQYVALAKSGEGEPLPVPTADKIKPHDVYPGVPQLAKRLKLLGDLHPDAPAPATNIYDGVLVKAVKHFQQRTALRPMESSTTTLLISWSPRLAAAWSNCNFCWSAGAGFHPISMRP